MRIKRYSKIMSELKKKMSSKCDETKSLVENLWAEKMQGKRRRSSDEIEWRRCGRRDGEPVVGIRKRRKIPFWCSSFFEAATWLTGNTNQSLSPAPASAPIIPSYPITRWFFQEPAERRLTFTRQQDHSLALESHFFFPSFSRIPDGSVPSPLLIHSNST